MTPDDQETNPNDIPNSGDYPFLQPETPERAAEYQRLALLQMKARQAHPLPLNYSLCYFYVSGTNLAFNEKFDEKLAVDTQWQHATASELFLRYFAPCNDASMVQLQQELLSIIKGMVQSSDDVANSADQRSGTLEQKVNDLAQCRDTKQALAITAEVLKESRALAAESRALSSDLQFSVKEIEKLKEELMHARREASIDTLTGLQNRRIFDVTLADLIEKDKPFSLILMDVDRFKQINDEHGHIIGDRVLRQLAKLMSARTRSSDTVTRYGGEEFAILLPNTPASIGKQVAEKIRDGIANLKMRRKDTGLPLGDITASLGVAEYRRSETALDFISRADAALYSAKRNGRNRVEIAL